MTGSPNASPLLPNHQYQGGTFAHTHRANSTKRMTQNQLAYREFLKTAVWGMLRDKCLERDNHSCTKCGSKLNVQAHHNVYRNSWHDTQLEDLTALCQICHRKAHGLHTNPHPRKKTQQPYKPSARKLRLIEALLKNNWRRQAS